MSRYKVSLSLEAEKDLEDVIYFDYKSPLTAFRYLSGLRKEMYKFQSSADTYQI